MRLKLLFSYYFPMRSYFYFRLSLRLILVPIYTIHWKKYIVGEKPFQTTFFSVGWMKYSCISSVNLLVSVLVHFCFLVDFYSLGSFFVFPPSVHALLNSVRCWIIMRDFVNKISICSFMKYLSFLTIATLDKINVANYPRKWIFQKKTIFCPFRYALTLLIIVVLLFHFPFSWYNVCNNELRGRYWICCFVFSKYFLRFHICLNSYFITDKQPSAGGG